MKIHLAKHYGMCFGVRDAIAQTREISASDHSATVLGELVHNPVVQGQLSSAGIEIGELEAKKVETDSVVFTAHGVANSVRKTWENSGKQVFDTTCPLVKKAHRSLECLVLAGFKPVVIGKRDHVEVRGLIGDFPEAVTILRSADISKIPETWNKIGVISQTTQPVTVVEALVSEIQTLRDKAEVRFIDTVCQPTKNRQQAIEELAAKCDTVIVVGGNNSNNTGQLAEKAREFGCDVFRVETAADLQLPWFARSRNVGVTAGTSTLEETVLNVVSRLEEFSIEKRRMSVFDSLKALA